MAKFKCHRCGRESASQGICCSIAREKVCPVCGYGVDNCICSGGSTKEPRVRH